MNEEWERLDLFSEKFWRYWYSFDLVNNPSSADTFRELNYYTIASESELKIFSLFSGEWETYLGRDEITQYLGDLKSSFNHILDEVLVDKDKGKVILYVRAVSTHFNPLLSENEAIDHVNTLTVKNNKITAVNVLYDTFKELKRTGQASFKSKSKEQINNYLQSLIQSGIIEKEYLNIE